MNNRTIAKIFQKTAQLLELHDANVFKVRSYQNAAINLEKLSEYIGNVPQTNWSEIQGVGKNLIDKISDIVDRGSFDELDQLMSETPKGVQNMLDIKGIGPKKIRSLWLDHDIDSKDKLIKACEDGALAEWKGFGEKTQKSILENLEYEAAQFGKVFYAEAEAIAQHLLGTLKAKGINNIEVCGQAAQYEETVSHLEFLSLENDALLAVLKNQSDFDYNAKISGPYSIRGLWSPKDLNITFHISSKKQFGNANLLLSADPGHLKTKVKNDTSLLDLLKQESFTEVTSIYKKLDLPYIPAELRGGGFEFTYASENKLDSLVKDSDLKGTLHNHSTYSDGKNSLREMAEKARDMGLNYLGISDHSKSAFYANGLDEDRIRQQHEEIDILNKEMAPFRIFKGIESDILNDGNLDYEKDVLASFDFIVSSIHSSLGMDIRKATARLIKV